MKPAKRQCSATSRSGNRCKKGPIPGGMVCRMHGGGAPQVKRKAMERLLDLIDPDRALREAACLAYSDIGQILTADGGFKPVKDWPEEFRRAVASIEYTKKNLIAGDGAQEDVVKVKLWDKSKNLEMLFKHLGLLIERQQIEGELVIKWESDAE